MAIQGTYAAVYSTCLAAPSALPARSGDAAAGAAGAVHLPHQPLLPHPCGPREGARFLQNFSGPGSTPSNQGACILHHLALHARSDVLSKMGQIDGAHIMIHITAPVCSLQLISHLFKICQFLFISQVYPTIDSCVDCRSASWWSSRGCRASSTWWRDTATTRPWCRTPPSCRCGT